MGDVEEELDEGVEEELEDWSCRLSSRVKLFCIISPKEFSFVLSLIFGCVRVGGRGGGGGGVGMEIEGLEGGSVDDVVMMSGRAYILHVE